MKQSKSKQTTRVKSVSTLLVRGDYSVLLMLRDNKPGIADPGMWGLISGRVESSESYQGAAAREIREETGLKIPLRFLARFVTIKKQDNLRQVFLVFGNWDQKDIVKGEGQKLEFIPIKKALSLPMGIDAHYIISLLIKRIFR